METRMRTPWGYAQDIIEIADGIISVSTASHGGIKLDRKRNAQVDKVWRRKGGWYEEDCEWAIAFLTFRHEFCAYYHRSNMDMRIHKEAHATVKNYYPDEYEKVFNMKVIKEESYKVRQRIFEETTRNKWVVFSAVGVEHDMVECYAKIGGRTGASVERLYLVPSKDYQVGEFGFILDPEKYQRLE